jgi:hypothetical protein
LPGFASPLIMLWRGWRPGAVRHVLRRSKVEQGVQQVEKGTIHPCLMRPSSRLPSERGQPPVA